MALFYACMFTPPSSPCPTFIIADYNWPLEGVAYYTYCQENLS